MKYPISMIGALGFSLLLAACGGGSSGGDNSASNSSISTSVSSSISSSTPQELPTAAITVEGSTGATFALADEPVTVTLSGAISTSPRNAALSYQWELVSKPATSNAVFGAVNTSSASFSADLPGVYLVSLVVDDGTAKSAPVRFTINATSTYPVAITQLLHSVLLGADKVELDASASIAPTDATTPLSYQWTLVSSPEDSAPYITNGDQAVATLYLDIAGEYRVRLVARHQEVASEPVEVVVTVSSGNAPPIAKASDVTVKRGEKVELSASASYDPENAPLEYRWSWDSTPKNAPVPELAGSKTVNASFTPDVVGTYTLDLFVFDGTWKSTPHTVTVTVEKPADAGNLAPVGELVATGYSPSASIGEQELGLRANFSFIGFDPNGDALQVVSAEIIEKPQGSTATLAAIGSWEPLGRKIQKLDVLGTYRVRMVISNGTQEITREATMVAKVGGVNNRPSTGGVEAQRPSVIVGEPFIFDASSSDKDLDPLSFQWELIDRPNNSKAVIETVLDEETREYRRARVLADVPGSYSVRMVVTDDRGLSGVSPAEATVFAKLSNAAPEIRSVVWTRNWGRLAPNESYFQILPCMSLLLRPTIVDLDGDATDYYEELVAKPEGGAFTSSTSEKNADCPNYSGLVFTKPGTYTLRYLASDGMDTSVPYDFNVVVESPENAKGVLLKSVGATTSLLLPLPYENIPAFGYGYSGIRPTAERVLNWSLEAKDQDYTIVDVKVSHINGNKVSLTPRFTGLVEGQVIKQGYIAAFSTIIPPVLCTRTDDETEGFHFSFRIKELPNVHFIYENYQSTSQGLVSEWPLCQPGQVE